MVSFGGYALWHVYDLSIQESRLMTERPIPGAQLAYRKDQTAGGRTIKVIGEIRGDPDHVLRLEELRRRVDDVARALDLEDGSSVINAKLGPIEAAWDVERGLNRVGFTVTFYETS